MQNLLDDLKGLLQQDERLVVDGKLLKNKIIELALQLDSVLIKMLLTHESIRKHFFQDVEGVMVFDKIKFQKFVSNKAFLPDSYTSFKNRIGLTDDDEFIKENKDVVLSWPYKDCVLEGGQTKEDNKRKEVFWNTTLAPDDIDRLFSPKVFTKSLKYSSEGVSEISELQPNDNLILKGNNLLILHSLKKRFLGKIKAIYLDPPYNTESDSFRYNDNFSQSTWLTFIKNRIEVAKELLSNDGFMFLHISFHQYAHLKVLLDEVFDGNHICTFNLLVRHPNRILKADKDFHDVMEYLLVFTKNKVANKIAKRIESTSNAKYKYLIEELNEGKTVNIGGQEITYFEPGDYKEIKLSASNDNLQKISIRGSLKEGNSSGRYYEKHLAPIKGDFPHNTIFKIPNMGKDKFDHRYFYTPEAGKSNGGYYQGVPTDSKDYKEKPYPNFFDFVKDFNNVGYEGEVEFRNGKKPEALIKQVFELGKVKEGDIVLDFFVGSGTTAAVAHKMGVQYIGIEQLDYGENDSVRRLEAVIKGENNGVSDEVNWSGGGSFVYAELKKLNSHIIDLIEEAKNEDDLASAFDVINKKGFISYKVDITDIDTNSQSFKELSFEDKQRFLIEILDKNQLYLNRSEIDDIDYSVSSDEKSFNHSFYKQL